MNDISYYLTKWFSVNGDFTFWSWVITITYIPVVFFSFVYTQKIKEEKQRHMLWLSISIFLLAMGINKQLDFQTLLLIVGKSLAYRTGLEKYGWFLGIVLATVVFTAILATGAVVAWKTRTVLHKEKTALTGTSIIILFVIIRAGTISHVYDAMLIQYAIYHIHALEFLGQVIILIALKKNFRKLKEKAAPKSPERL